MNSQIIPGVIMVGAVPIFYRIPITAELVHCVRVGMRPPEETLVQRCVPPVPNQDAYPEEGLVPLANRRIVMKRSRISSWVLSMFHVPVDLFCHPGYMTHGSVVVIPE